MEGTVGRGKSAQKGVAVRMKTEKKLSDTLSWKGEVKERGEGGKRGTGVGNTNGGDSLGGEEGGRGKLKMWKVISPKKPHPQKKKTEHKTSKKKKTKKPHRQRIMSLRDVRKGKER